MLHLFARFCPASGDSGRFSHPLNLGGAPLIAHFAPTLKPGLVQTHSEEFNVLFARCLSEFVESHPELKDARDGF